MASRDLTRSFMQLRSDAKARVLRRKHMVTHVDEAANALIKNQQTPLTKENDALNTIPQWVDIVNETNQYIAEIKNKMENLHKLHTKRLMVRFDGSESEHEAQIERLTEEITNAFRRTEKGLQRMSSKEHLTDQSQADAKTRQNVQRALALQLQSLSGTFRKSQKEYLARVKHQKQGPKAFDFLSETQSSKNTARMSMDTGFNQAQITEMEIQEDLINERDIEIQRIATSITELATIFKELAILVIDQGTILDRIDYNMEQVVEQTTKGMMELEKAEKTQQNSRPMKCIGLLLALICLMTIILVLKHT